MIANIPGASASVAVDDNFNIVTGIGYAPATEGDPDSVNRTGELKIWRLEDWKNDNGMFMSNYDDNNRLLGANVLSSASLSFTEQGDLCVGGGDAFGSGGPSENGYAALINHKVVSRVLEPDTADPTLVLDETNEAECRHFAPDPCQNDSATGILAYGKSLSISWNSTNASCNQGAADDYYNPGVAATLTTYTVNKTRDADGDGHPDISDHSPSTFDQANIDSDGDGYGNVIDGDLNNDDVIDLSDFYELRAKFGTTDAETDLNLDGNVDLSDFYKLRGMFGKSAPYYNF